MRIRKPDPNVTTKYDFKFHEIFHNSKSNHATEREPLPLRSFIYKKRREKYEIDIDTSIYHYF